jgi:hypothetical protein
MQSAEKRISDRGRTHVAVNVLDLTLRVDNRGVPAAGRKPRRCPRYALPDAIDSDGGADRAPS